MKNLVSTVFALVVLHFGLAAQSGYSISQIPFHPDPFTGGTDAAVSSDDGFSPKIALPFSFCFADSSFDTVVIGGNGVVSFQASYALGFCQYLIDTAAPHSRYPNLSILAPMIDLDISQGGTIQYNVFGIAPHRRFVVSYDSVRLFDNTLTCGPLFCTQQVILYETSNIIESHILQKPLCAAWNHGGSILGIQIDSATGFIASNHNYPTQWAATNESWRFTPYGNCAGATDDISGRVTTSANASLQFQQVFLLRYDTTLHVLVPIDSVLTDADGYYAFNNVSDTLVYLKAVPDSTDYPTEMPTYADTTMYWMAAAVFHPRLYPVIMHDFQTKFGSNPSGPGFVSGIVTEGANKASQVGDPIRGIRVVLRQINTGTILGYRDSDVNGFFSFGNVPFGDYQLIPDQPNISISNVPQFTVSSLTPLLDSLDLVLHSNYMELVVTPTEVAPQTGDFTLQVSPNPFSHSTELNLDLPMTRNVNIRLLDMMGRQADEVFAGILPMGMQHFTVGEGKAAGCYFLQVTVNGKTQVMKVMKGE